MLKRQTLNCLIDSSTKKKTKNKLYQTENSENKIFFSETNSKFNVKNSLFHLN